MQIVVKLDQSQDAHASYRIAKQILDFLELHAGDYRMNQVSLIYHCKCHVEYHFLFTSLFFTLCLTCAAGGFK